MINAHNYTKTICQKASQLGFKLRLTKEGFGYSWQWQAGNWFPIVGAASPSDPVASLAMACEDLAKAMGWEYTE